MKLFLIFSAVLIFLVFGALLVVGFLPSEMLDKLYNRVAKKPRDNSRE
jgi:hypothetical protein